MRGDDSRATSTPAVGTNPDFAVTEALVELVERQCGEGPVALLLDDGQWADPASLLVVHRLGRLVAQLPLLIIATCRPFPREEDLERLLRSLEARGSIQIPLGALDTPAVAELVWKLTGAPPGRRLAGLVAGAAGNPLYLTELVAALVRDGHVDTIDGVAELTNGSGAVPPSLSATIVHRLDFLPRLAREVLQTAAVLGPKMHVTELAAVVDRPVTEVVDIVRAAVAAYVLSSESGQLSFRHEVIRQALAEEMQPAVRAAVHLRAARILASAGVPVEHVAQLLVAGDTDPWARQWLLDNADPVVVRAPALAVDLVGKTLEQINAGDSNVLELRLHLARALLWARRPAEAEQVARMVLASGVAPERANHLRWLIAQTCFQQGRLREAEELVNDVLATGRLTAADSARCQHFAAQCRLTRGRADSAKEEASALALIAQADPVASFFGLYYLSGVRYVQGRMADSLDVMERAIAASGTLEAQAEWDTPVEMYRANLLGECDRFDEAQHSFDAGLRLAKRFGSIYVTWYHVGKGRLYLLDGRWDDALAEVQAGLAAIEIAGPNRGAHARRGLHGLAALISLRRGNLTSAMPLVERAFAPKKTAFYDYLGVWAHALLREAQGDSAEAFEVLYQFWEHRAGARQQLGVPYLCPDLVRLALALGSLRRAHLVIDDLAELAARQSTPTLRGIHELCRGLAEEDVDLVLAAADTFGTVGRPLYEGHAHESAAALLAPAGETAAAQAHLAAALERYDRLQATWDARRARSRLRRHDIVARRPYMTSRHKIGWEALTPTERTIARMITEGHSTPDIAARLFISRRTVQSHVSNILTKLECASLAELTVTLLHRSGEAST